MASEMTAIQLFFTFRFSALATAILKPLIVSTSRSWRVLTLMGCVMTAASADEQFEDFKYTDDGTSITITGYPTTALGAVIVPDTIDVLDTSVTPPVMVPRAVKAIGLKAFYACEGITSVTIPSAVTSIGNLAFAYCTLLESVPLPASLSSIGTQAFFRCRAMTSANIPPGVTNIGSGAFVSCSSLTSIVIPFGLTGISFGTFESCAGLTSVTFQSGVNPQSGQTVPSSVTSIGTQAFRYCNGLASFTIPSTVASIGDNAFYSCKGLLSVEIPSSVIGIGNNALADCSALTTITVNAANPNFSSVDGILTNKLQTTLITCPAGKTGAITVPSGVSSIGASAFLYCAKVTGVTFPTSLTGNIGDSAFKSCTLLTHATFTGNAPTMGSNVFFSTASGFTIYYLETTIGFTSPKWYGYDAISTDGSNNPLASWLMSKGLPANSDLHSDSNGDGVNLLMAYALNLEPAQNLSNAIPQGTITAGQMSLSFYSGASGVTYAVQCSSDMVHWSSAGVSYSNNGQIRTATVAPSGANCFMRLAVSY